MMVLERDFSRCRNCKLFVSITPVADVKRKLSADRAIVILELEFGAPQEEVIYDASACPSLSFVSW